MRSANSAPSAVMSGAAMVVAPPVPRVAGQSVQVPPVLLDVLAVVALRAGDPERAPPADFGARRRAIASSARTAAPFSRTATV
jgi:hypothetical protein